MGLHMCCWRRGMQDLFDMVQSQTFVSQIGYGLIRIVLVNLMPELRPLFHSIERGPSEISGGRQGESASQSKTA